VKQAIYLYERRWPGVWQSCSGADNSSILRNSQDSVQSVAGALPGVEAQQNSADVRVVLGIGDVDWTSGEQQQDYWLLCYVTQTTYSAAF